MINSCLILYKYKFFLSPRKKQPKKNRWDVDKYWLFVVNGKNLELNFNQNPVSAPFFDRTSQLVRYSFDFQGNFSEWSIWTSKYKILLILRPEEWQSGRMRRSWKPLSAHADRGFESLFLRQLSKQSDEEAWNRTDFQAFFIFTRSKINHLIAIVRWVIRWTKPLSQFSPPI